MPAPHGACCSTLPMSRQMINTPSSGPPEATRFDSRALGSTELCGQCELHLLRRHMLGCVSPEKRTGELVGHPRIVIGSHDRTSVKPQGLIAKRPHHYTSNLTGEHRRFGKDCHPDVFRYEVKCLLWANYPMNIFRDNCLVSCHFQGGIVNKGMNPPVEENPFVLG